jgi:hypothetical protein
MHHRPLFAFAGGDISPDGIDGAAAIIDKNGLSGTSAQGFQPQRAGTGEEIQDRPSPANVPQYVKDRLSNAIGGGSDRLSPRGVQPPPFIFTGDDAQSLSPKYRAAMSLNAKIKAFQSLRKSM